MSKRLLRDYLQDILNTIDAIEEFLEGVNFLTFPKTQKRFLLFQELSKSSEKPLNSYLILLDISTLIFSGEILQG